MCKKGTEKNQEYSSENFVNFLNFQFSGFWCQKTGIATKIFREEIGRLQQVLAQGKKNLDYFEKKRAWHDLKVLQNKLEDLPIKQINENAAVLGKITAKLGEFLMSTSMDKYKEDIMFLLSDFKISDTIAPAILYLLSHILKKQQCTVHEATKIFFSSLSYHFASVKIMQDKKVKKAEFHSLSSEEKENEIKKWEEEKKRLVLLSPQEKKEHWKNERIRFKMVQKTIFSQEQKEAIHSIGLQLLYFLEVENILVPCRKYISDFTDSKPGPRLCYKLSETFLKGNKIFILENLPMIMPPVDWYLEESTNELVGGGYFLKPSFYRKDSEYKEFATKAKKPLADVLNGLQKIGYYVSFPQEYYDKTEAYLVHKIGENESNVSFYQNELVALQFAKVFKDLVIFYPRCIDGRGRIYSHVVDGLCPIHSQVARAVLAMPSHPVSTTIIYEPNLYFYWVGDRELFYLEAKIGSLLGAKGKDSEKRSFFLDHKQKLLENIEYSFFENPQEGFHVKKKDFFLLIRYLIEYSILINLPPEKRISCLSIELDANSSGLQFNALFTNNLQGMQLTNLIKPQDEEEFLTLYDYVVNCCKKKDSKFALFYTRSLIKQIIMTLTYGATDYRHKIQILDSFKEELSNFSDQLREKVLALPFWTEREKLSFQKESLSNLSNKVMNTFKKNHLDSLLRQIYAVFEKEVPFFKILLSSLQREQREKNAKKALYTVETDFISYQNCYPLVKVKPLFVYVNPTKTKKRKSISFYQPIDGSLDKKKMRNAISANVIQGAGDAHFIHHFVLKYPTFGFFPNHDSFFIRLCDVDQLKELIILGYSEVYLWASKSENFKKFFENSSSLQKIDSSDIFSL